MTYISVAQRLKKMTGYLVIVFSVFLFRDMQDNFKLCTQFCNFMWFLIPIVFFFFGMWLVEDSNAT